MTWPAGKKSPKSKQLVNLAGVGALQGAFWGMLFGLIFFVPFFGMAVGAAMGALGGKMADYGISDDFITQTRAQVTEGTSALFLMTSAAVQDKALEGLKGYQFELIASNMTKEQEDRCATGLAEEQSSQRAGSWRCGQPTPRRFVDARNELGDCVEVWSREKMH